MAKQLYNALKSNPVYQLWLILGLAAISRIFYAFYSPSPAALDDFVFIVKPALVKIQTGNWIEIADYRSELYAYIYYGIFNVANILGLTSPLQMNGLANALVALFSVWGLWGFYLLAGNYLSKPNQMLVLLIAALHPLMPLYSTKPLIESFAMFTLPGGLYFLTKQTQSSRDFILGGLLVSLSAFFRIQVGIIVLGISIWLMIKTFRKQISWNNFIEFHVAGLFVLLLLGASDMLFGKGFMETTWNYIELNFATNIVTAKYGSVPWYMYIAFFSVLFIPPFSLILLPAFFRSIPKATLLFVLFSMFVFLHSLLENKLERFMATVLPLFFLLTLVGHEKKIQSFYDKWEAFSIKAVAFIIVIFLPFVLTQRSQVALIQAADYLRKTNTNQISAYYTGDFWFQAYYGYNFPKVKTRASLENAYKEEQNKPFFMLAHAAETTEQMKQNCSLQKTFQPDLIEMLAYTFNPENNKRRAPLLVYLCNSKQNPK